MYNLESFLVRNFIRYFNYFHKHQHNDIKLEGPVAVVIKNIKHCRSLRDGL